MSRRKVYILNLKELDGSEYVSIVSEECGYWINTPESPVPLEVKQALERDGDSPEEYNFNSVPNLETLRNGRALFCPPLIFGDTELDSFVSTFSAREFCKENQIEIIDIYSGLMY